MYRGEPLTYYMAKAKTTSGTEKVNALYAIGQFGADAASGSSGS